MEIQYSRLKINHLEDTPSTKAAGGRIYCGVLLKDIKVLVVKVRRTLSSVGTSLSNTHNHNTCCATQKHQHHDLLRPLTSSGFNFLGECNCSKSRN